MIFFYLRRLNIYIHLREIGDFNMGSTSVTGKGPGSSEMTAKGPKERGFVGVEKLIGPRVVVAGNVTLATGSATVTFTEPLPCVTPLSAAAATPTPQLDYVVICVDRTTAANHVTVAFTNSDATGDTTVAAGLKNCVKSMTLTGTGTDVIGYVVVKVGDAI